MVGPYGQPKTKKKNILFYLHLDQGFPSKHEPRTTFEFYKKLRTRGQPKTLQQRLT